MNVTHESTGLDDANRARREGSELWGRTKALLDELDWSRVELHRLQAEKAERNKRLDDGRQTTSKRLRGVVLAAVTDIHARLKEDVYANRRHKLEEHLRIKWKHYGLEQLPDGTVKLPNRKLLREVLTSQGL